MANSFFQFQQFTVWQDRCAMKVGTDGTLLGAWAHGGSRILDVGTGTGVMALMMAQRFPQAHVTGIDVDPDAVMQARGNVGASPFVGRIDIEERDVKLYVTETPFDAIVANPPYFNDSLQCPDQQRTVARHTVSLSYQDLLGAVKRLLADDGEFSVIIPFDSLSRIESEAALAGLFMSRMCAVKTTPKKSPRRCLLAFRKHLVAEQERGEEVIETRAGVRSPWYAALTKDFYLCK